MKDSYKIIGLMSGTSLDGLDLAYCHFQGNDRFEIIACDTISYSQAIKSQLASAHLMAIEELMLLDHKLCTLHAEAVKDFIKQHDIKEVDAVASHGHTVLHQPHLGVTLQIVSPSKLAASTNIKCVGDFRTADVALGGQGAPLVPIGDRELFGNYRNRVNLGGFANISFEEGDRTIAFDICPLNIVLNHWSAKKGLPYDKGGAMASSGNVDEDLLKQLNDLPFYQSEGPKSLGKEWVEEVISPLLDGSGLKAEDILATFCEHAAIQIANVLKKGSSLFTGGGAYNNYLRERIAAHSKEKITLADDRIIDYKEALIFAYLGMKRLKNENNVLASVTGAQRDHCAGSVHLP